MLRIARLEGEQDLDLIHGQVDAGTVMLHGQDVQPHLGHGGGEGGQGAGPVVEHDPQHQVAAR